MALSPAKQALLEKWLQVEQTPNVDSIIPTRPLNSAIKISYAQQAYLFLELLDRGTAVNNLSVFLQLKGNLDTDAMSKSANQILARHEILRTRFSFDTGIPLPEIFDEARINIPVVELKALDEKGQETEASHLAEHEVLQPFDLFQTLLVRLRLYKAGRDKYFLLLVAHHTVADGWSLGVFLNELIIFYEANITGTVPQLPILPIQYFDYTHFQNSEKQEQLLRSSISYWKKQLSGELPTLELPVDHPRGNRQTFAGGTHRFIISKSQTKALEAISRQEDSTLFMTLLAAFYILLHRYTGQDDILVGIPIANRNYGEVENLIGVFINTLVMRASLNDNPGFRELLRQVRKISLEAYAHQDLPYEKLVEELKPTRDLNRPPLFQVVFNLQNSPMPKLEMPGIETTFIEIDRGLSQFDLTLMISRREEQCEATVEYNADLFGPTTITRMFDAYQMLLHYALTQPDSPISALQLVTGEELHHIVFNLNQTTIAFPQGKCIHVMIEEQVEKTPDAIAVIYGQRQLTYRELNLRANTLAKHLRNLGIGPERRVGVLMKKSERSIEALLGVLKAGGAYVPIHISSPPSRIQFILKDADAKILLTNIDCGPLDEFTGITVNLENENFLAGSDTCFENSLANSNNLAYIIYTSGSTGEPKGVMVNHSSIMNFLVSMRNSPGMDKSSVILALASISFDPSTLELFLPLMVGAKVIMADEEMTTNPWLIAEAIDRHDINILQATPATWQLLLDIGWAGKPGLKALCGGEVLTRKMANQLLKKVGSLWNVYGPTETTVWSTLSKIEKGDTPVTIGTPISNVRMYLLDRYLQIVPVGVTGELFIAGEGLARGYLNNPQLTGEKFIEDIFDSKAGSRLYKTGDLGRYLPDYSIEIVGRRDDQVKMQGHRIELGEITSVLLRHPLVSDGIVLARKETSGNKRLIAYFVAKHNAVPDAAAFREFFGKILPDYMIPSFFIKMDSLPLTINGKIDRKSLPPPGEVLQLSGYVAPRNEEEEIMVQIWQNVLNVEQVGIYDNFFDLGGASIQSIHIVARCNMYGYKVSVENIFEYQTIAELATRIKEIRSSGG
ncbi:MAG: amino acid adenylation domain-containing protein [Ginsengibacter sp.]